MQADMCGTGEVRSLQLTLCFGDQTDYSDTEKTNKTHPYKTPKGRNPADSMQSSV